MSQPPPWDGSGQQDPRQYQGPYQGQPQQPYGQTAQWPQPPYPEQQQPYPGQQQPGYIPPPGRPPRQSWAARHKVLTGLIVLVGLFIVASIGAAAGKGGGSAAPAPTVTVTEIQHDPGSTVTVTATPTANAQGEATQISSDGVYVIGKDIAGGTWHTSGGQQCYEATLSSTDTSNIIDNNNFTGPDTVSLTGAKAFDISGGCTWQHEG